MLAFAIIWILNPLVQSVFINISYISINYQYQYFFALKLYEIYTGRIFGTTGETTPRFST